MRGKKLYWRLVLTSGAFIINSDNDTKERRMLDVAKILIKTSLQDSTKKNFRVQISGRVFSRV